MHYYTHNIGEFAAATRFMSPEEIGVYVILKDEYYATGMRLACDRIANLMPPQCEDSLKRVLQRFFREENGFYVNDAFEAELDSYKDKGSKNRENAKKRWEKKRSATESDANGCESHEIACESDANGCLTNNQEPITNNQELIKEKNTKKKLVLEKPDGVSQQVWADFVALRKQKKAPLTETALKGIVREAQKAGITLEDALSTCCQRGWQGFNSEWILGKANGQTVKVQTGPKTLEPDWSQIDYGEGGFL